MHIIRGYFNTENKIMCTSVQDIKKAGCQHFLLQFSNNVVIAAKQERDNTEIASYNHLITTLLAK